MGRSYAPKEVPLRDVGCVAVSSAVRNASASPRSFPHISIDGRNETQNAGRSGLPNSLQRSWSSNCTQATPAGLPCGIPGIGEVIDGAMQQAAQWLRQGKVEAVWIT